MIRETNTIAQKSTALKREQRTETEEQTGIVSPGIAEVLLHKLLIISGFTSVSWSQNTLCSL